MSNALSISPSKLVDDFKLWCYSNGYWASHVGVALLRYFMALDSKQRREFVERWRRRQSAKSKGR